MINFHFEIAQLRERLSNSGLDPEVVETLVSKAENEILTALSSAMDQALERAVQAGVEKDSKDFINELRPRPDAFILETESSRTDFSDPPYPMLDRLLSGAKPMKDGSGVYKIIPVGATSTKPKPKIHTNIFDAQKALMAQRAEEAKEQYQRIIPKGSKGEPAFRTATSKQNRNTQWVMPEKEKDFAPLMEELNQDLSKTHDEIVREIIKNYEDFV